MDSIIWKKDDTGATCSSNYVISTQKGLAPEYRITRLETTKGIKYRVTIAGMTWVPNFSIEGFDSKFDAFTTISLAKKAVEFKVRLQNRR